ncbi:MAG: 4Fe-4S dicluster domain-containing protein [Promethearchaeota archaeon]
MEKSENINPIESLHDEFTDTILGTNLNLCYNCSTCSTICPVALETEGHFNPRSIILLANFGHENRLVADLVPNVWDCTMCELCQEACPEGVNLHEVFLRIKNASARFQNIPKSYTSETNQVYIFGKAVPSQPVIEKRRKQLGLPESPETNVEEIKKLMGMTPVEKILLEIEKKENTAEAE